MPGSSQNESSFFKSCHFHLLLWDKPKTELMTFSRLFYNVCFACLILGCAKESLGQDKPESRELRRLIHKTKSWENNLSEWNHLGRISIDSVAIREDSDSLLLFFSRPLSYLPAREETFSRLETSVRSHLGRRYRKHAIRFLTDGKDFRDLIPNLYRNQIPADTSRRVGQVTSRNPLVRKEGISYPTQGLYNRYIALWPSHGWYYESKLDRWEWQRARLFGTVEDLFTRGFVLPYLVPMLENSGATVMLPVERDTQSDEVIADIDGSSPGAVVVTDTSLLKSGLSVKGFLYRSLYYPGDNPFLMGTAHLVEARIEPIAPIFFHPGSIEGEYAVYVSYPNSGRNSDDVKYTVIHAAGETVYRVNQQMGGGTWIYLGNHRFSQPLPGRKQGVLLHLSGQPGRTIGIDAVRFGGGMGNIARRPAGATTPNQWSLNDTPDTVKENILQDSLTFSWKTSGKPRFMEGARYFLQYAGFPDTLVYDLTNGTNDYNDDYMSRGEWVNYLLGAPSGPLKDRQVNGLQIPVDLALAFHTDAGVTQDDSVIGTLAIYSTQTDEGFFPSGMSRMASRDLSDLVQSQIVQDIRMKFDDDWTRRGLWNRQYSEAWRPNVPSMLLELLSHQNLGDMRYGLDPKFRFLVARAIYKGIARFLCQGEGLPVVFHPLPPDHFGIIPLEDGKVRLQWQPVTDPLEPTAVPTYYKVYRDVNGTGFMEFMSVTDTFLVFEPENSGNVYQFQITACNIGGESFPSETLSMRLSGLKGMGLVVNAFDRISGPGIFDTGSMAGIEWWNDLGVEDGTGYITTGPQYDFDKSSPWLDDDSPGWGASHSESEGNPVPGNSRGFTINHGESIFGNNGYSWISVSDEVFAQPEFDIHPYFAVSVLAGEEKAESNDPQGSAIFSPGMRNQLKKVADNGGNIFLSGSYVGTDFMTAGDTLARNFAAEVLKYRWTSGNATRKGDFYSTDYGLPWFRMHSAFNAGQSSEMYAVESPDILAPAGPGTFVPFRYASNHSAASVAWSGNYKVLVLGFPFEAIHDLSGMNQMGSQIMNFFEGNSPGSVFQPSTGDVYDHYGALVRTDPRRKVVHLIFSAHDTGEGFRTVLDVLDRYGIKASFFLTGHFLRQEHFRQIVHEMVERNHYVGPHSDNHLLYMPWENRDSLLVTHDMFKSDLRENLVELEKYGIKSKEVTWYLAPYEWYNQTIVNWTAREGMKLLNFTPGIGTQADYTTPDMGNYRSSDQLLEGIWRFESSDVHGLNGVIMLIHPGTETKREDKLYLRLEQIIQQLISKGYTFRRF